MTGGHPSKKPCHAAHQRKKLVVRPKPTGRVTPYLVTKISSTRRAPKTHHELRKKEGRRLAQMMRAFGREERTPEQQAASIERMRITQEARQGGPLRLRQEIERREARVRAMIVDEESAPPPYGRAVREAADAAVEHQGATAREERRRQANEGTVTWQMRLHAQLVIVIAEQRETNYRLRQSNAMEFLTLLLRIATLVVLTTLIPSAMGQTLQRKVGEVHSPIQYARVHFFVTPWNCEAELHRLMKTLNTSYYVMKSQGADEEEMLRMDQQLSILAAGVREVRADARLLRQTMGMTPEHELAEIKQKRSERSPVLIAAGAAVVAPGLIALGLGIHATIQVANLEERLEDLEAEHGEIIASIERLEAQQEHEMKRLDEAIHRGDRRAFRIEVISEAQAVLAYFQNKVRDQTRAYYRLMSGQLDPGFVSVRDLHLGLEKVKEKAERLGMKPAPLENKIEGLFSLPVTAVSNRSGINIFATVPLVPRQAPVFNVLKITHHPLFLGGDKWVNFQLDYEYLLIDEAKQYFAELKGDDLRACDRHKRSYFCSLHQFNTKPQSCTTALVHGDRKMALATCAKEVYSAPIMVMPRVNSSFDLDVWTREPTTIVKLCPGNKEEPLQRFVGRKTVEMGPGCYLRSDHLAVFLTNRLESVEVACHGQEWQAIELLDGETTDHVSQVLRNDGPVSIRLKIADLKRRVSRKPQLNLALLLAGIGLCIISVFTFWFAVRASFLASVRMLEKSKQKRSGQQQQHDDGYASGKRDEVEVEFTTSTPLMQARNVRVPVPHGSCPPGQGH